jgi:hypothetical protein
MYLRFITEFRDEYDEIKTGVFQAMGYLCRTDIMYDFDKRRLMELRDLFNLQLERPTRFSKSLKKNAPKVSLSWYKSTATQHLTKMYEVKELMAPYGIFVTVIKRENPGYIVYEDEYQVSTLPHKADKHLAK